MWGKLLQPALKRISKVAKTKFVPTYARTIVQKGNGQKRAIISGFGDANLDENHFKLLNYYARLNIRPIIAGFTGQKGMVKRLTAFPGRGFIKFFPKFKNPKMRRHVVYDVQTQRQAIKGFSFDSNQEIIKIGSPQTQKAIQRPQLASERTVIQGFGNNPSTPIMKQVDTNSKRVIVKGFSA